MKRILLLLLLSVLCSPHVRSQSLSHLEDFDNYTAGDYLAKSSTYWQTWTNNPGGSDDVRVSNTDATSGSNSLYMGAGATKEDIVLLFNKKKKLTKGQFILKMQMKIPSGSSGYINLQGDTFFGTGGTWTSEIKFSTTGALTFTGMTPTFTGSYPQGRWFEFKIVANLSLNIWDIYVDGSLVSSHSNSANSVTGMNVYGDVSTNSYWLDDIYFAHYMPGPDDAGVVSIDSPAVHCAGSTRNIYATVGNFGKNQIKKLTINWSVNGKTKTAVTYTGTLDTLNGGGSQRAKVKLGSHTFQSTADTIKVWTSLPNGNKDTLNVFDTMLVIRRPTPPPTPSAGTDRDMCYGTSTKVGTTGQPGHKYSWTSNPAGFTGTGFNAVVSPTVTTTYYLTMTNTATGCSGIDSVVVNVMAAPTVAMDTVKSICKGDSVQVGPSVIEQTYSYYWTSTPAGFTSNNPNPYLKPSATTTYKLTVSNINLCTATEEVVVTVNNLPNAFGGADKNICKGESVQIGWSPVNGETYSWRSIPAGFTSSTSNPTVKPTADTTKYILTVTNASGCKSEDEVLVTITPMPVADAGADAQICAGASAKIGAAAVPGQTYSWTSRPAGFTDFAANPTVSPKVTTTYKLVARNSNGCTTEDSVTVTIVAPPVADAGAAKAICAGESVSIGTTAANGVTYSWTSVPAGFTSTDAMPVVSPTANTTYKVVATNATGCTSESQVTVTIKPVPVADAGTAKTICPGIPTQIGTAAVTGNTYSWTSVPAGFTSADANPTVSPMVTTTYKLVVTGAEGCKAESQVTITAALPTSNFTAKTSGHKVEFKAANKTYTKYVWNFRDGSRDSSGPELTHTFPADGNFRVTLTVTHPDGCTSSTDSTIKVDAVGIDPVETAVADVRIFPNPFSSATTLTYTLQKRAQVNITLLDVTGKQVAQLVKSTLPGGDHSLSIKADDYKLKAGIYFVQIQVDGAASTRKIMKVE